MSSIQNSKSPKVLRQETATGLHETRSTSRSVDSAWMGDRPIHVILRLPSGEDNLEEMIEDPETNVEWHNKLYLYVV